MLTDRDRIAADAARPLVVEFWRALQPLRSVVSFMSTGAHPDDETSGMLAALGFRDGFDLSFACATRGEGGQNDIGAETEKDLGVLRTAEMERAAEVLNLRLYWLSEISDDAIFDFGFSKSGVETLAKWGRERTLKRFVEIVRTEKPDMICPTFLDVPGQHGHHRAMTEAAHSVIDAAADPAYPEVALAPWQVTKLYLPAWSGAGQSYDDDLPPPPATITIAGGPADPVTGWSWEQIGQQSRAFHQTQGMGRWIPSGTSPDWPLHLARSEVAGPDRALTSGLPATLRELADRAGAAAPFLGDAQNAIEEALAAFPDRAAISRSAARALRSVREARKSCPTDDVHRLDRKEAQLARVIRIASGVHVAGHFRTDWLHPGDEAAITIEQDRGAASTLSVALALPEGWTAADNHIAIAEDAAPSDPYPPAYDPQHPRAPALRVQVTVDGAASETAQAFEITPAVLPRCSVSVAPEAVFLNTATPARSFHVAISERAPQDAACAIVTPEGWSVQVNDAGFDIGAPADLADGLYHLPLTLDGEPATTVRRLAFPHTGPRARWFPAETRVRALAVLLPDVRIGYVGGGNDRVLGWLQAMGLAANSLSDQALGDPATLSKLDTIVVGIFAMRTRPALHASMPRIHQWIEAGGTLLTLYHRPWDAWDPEAVPPRRLEIGQPSLRWRVTDEAAVVTHLAPDHPILNTPNIIGEADWAGWSKERGLYFAKAWDAAYTPLLAMADPGEEPHRGSLLSAAIGAGRHTHTSLILHHQMEKLIPGAFRLMANLVA